MSLPHALLETWSIRSLLKNKDKNNQLKVPPGSIQGRFSGLRHS